MTTGRTAGAAVVTARHPVGAASHNARAWNQTDWHQLQRNVRRLQVRIVKATQEGRWNRVAALQRLLTRSFSGKALAVRRVTTNRGRRTPGVDGATWPTPGRKWTAIATLRQHGYRPKPLRRDATPGYPDGPSILRRTTAPLLTRWS